MQNAPKKFLESIYTGMSEEVIVIGLKSGQELSVYALTPEHLKRASQHFALKLAEYEKLFGVVDADLNRGMRSPFDMSSHQNTAQDSQSNQDDDISQRKNLKKK